MRRLAAVEQEHRGKETCSDVVDVELQWGLTHEYKRYCEGIHGSGKVQNVKRVRVLSTLLGRLRWNRQSVLLAQLGQENLETSPK